MGAFRKLRDRRRASPDEGAALVEFVAVFPVVLMFLFAIFELGWMGFAFSETWTSAREGARQATTVNSQLQVDRLTTCDSVRSYVTGRVALRTIDANDITVRYFNPAGALVADCQGGTAPETLGCQRVGGAVVCPENPLAGITVEVTVTQSHSALGVPLLSNVLDGVSLTTTQTRSVQSGREFEVP
jgi:Flp pilus assembly protein TadG